MNAQEVIPPITDPIALATWKQPHRRFIELDDKSALMSKQTFNGLKEYSASMPSGTSNGKMWKAQYGDKWFLYWYDHDVNPLFLSVHRREILVV